MSTNTEHLVTRVLIVDDSATIRTLLKEIIDAEPDCEVVGFAGDGQAAIEMAAELRPDIVTLDLRMPGMDGYEAIPKIVEYGCRVIVVSGAEDKREIRTALDMMKLGPVEIVPKPGVGEQIGDFVSRVKSKVSLLAQASSASWPSLRTSTGENESISAKDIFAPPGEDPIVVFGGSTGAPGTMIEVLQSLPKPFPAPIIIAQHIANGFVGGLADWVGRDSGHKVEVARGGSLPMRGRVYLVPVPRGLKFGRNFRFTEPDTDEVRTGHGSISPSIDLLLKSAASIGARRVLAVLFSGMGRDGTAGLGELIERGGVGFVQDLESCVVPGIPGAVLEAGLDVDILHPDVIGEHITKWALATEQESRRTKSRAGESGKETE